MRALPFPLRKLLEASVLAARRAAESASRAAIDGVGVFADCRPKHLDATQAALRNGLRTKWRQLGRDRELLVAECAYEQWHRLLFARFLAENGLLLHPQYKAPVTLADCEELAAELGEPDAWSVAARFASEILPGIFRLDDPCVRLRLAPEGRHALEQILDAIPKETFAADDALGWVYQFWQKDKKDEVKSSERKIGGADLGPVTQLFTENYMVRFLLENSLGAWWAVRHPDSPLVKGFDYLRFDEDGRPVTGSFDNWPDRIAKVTVMDPCCGSGHFLVEAFSMLWQMRAEEESLAPVDAQNAVLRDNLFGLELDARCVQIAMFAVALQAWKSSGGWRDLQVPNIACSGIPVKAPAEDWKAFADGDARLEAVLVRLHGLFRDADSLGSLLDPTRTAEVSYPTTPQLSFDDVDWKDISSLVHEALTQEIGNPVVTVLGAGAAGIARAAELLSRNFTLVITNPPFLGRGAQASALRDYCVRNFPDAESELANVMTERWSKARSRAFVLPQNWLFMDTFRPLRERVLRETNWTLLARLGHGAFDAISGQVVQTVLWIADSTGRADQYAEVSAMGAAGSIAKAAAIQSGAIVSLSQSEQFENPGSVVVAGGALKGPYISDIADARSGLTTGDSPSFIRSFWEVPALGDVWERLQSAPDGSGVFSGCEKIILWENEKGRLAAFAESVSHLNTATQGWRRGKPFWGSHGVIVKLMGDLHVCPYFGERYDLSCAVIHPRSEEDLGALWHYAASGDLEATVRSFHSKLSIESGTLLAAPLDVDRWRKVATEAGQPPKPFSNDPTQWLFQGRPESSTMPLHVAVARSVGYRWPEQVDCDDLDAFADADGIVCLPSVAGEVPAADRVQQLLAVAFGEALSPAKVKKLLEQVGSKKTNLADWLQDEFFKQHCTLFGNRPFVWHIWDGQRDGFSALVNYHRLDRRTLEKLTYTYLGQDWVERQRAEVRDKVAGAKARLSAALGLQRKLEAILDGEAPFDIYVRWKEAHEQPIGWDPDLNDGVRLNVRPFVEAGVLRAPFNVHWRKDRGKNPDGSERDNDKHLQLAEKIAARKRAAQT
jgi:hypothetical protein